MNIRLVETRYEALDAIGHALKEGLISFAVAGELRDLARAGRVAEVKQRLTFLEETQLSKS